MDGPCFVSCVIVPPSIRCSFSLVHLAHTWIFLFINFGDELGSVCGDKLGILRGFRPMFETLNVHACGQQKKIVLLFCCL
jgi:hypothetical protein